MTFDVLKGKPTYAYKMRIKSLEKQKKELKKLNREREKAILEYNKK